MPHCREIKLGDVWRTCNKIRAAIFRIGFNLWDFYLPLDPERNCLISESKFVSVLLGPLKAKIGLSDQEISELADYFRVQDGRILYTQFCEVIHDSVPDFAKNEPLVTGLEWEDPLHLNRISVAEERRLFVLITKIAADVNMRRIILRPYFQDYELVAKNAGTVTIAHFARILAFLKILVSKDDFHLLLKKYLKDSYTVNYVAFVLAVDAAVKQLDTNNMLDLGGDVLSQFPGRLINAELPKLPRPELGKITAASVFGKQTIFHPCLETQKIDQDLITLLRRIQRHIYENRIRIHEFFRDFDQFNCGRITLSQFHRGLDALGLSGIQRMYLSLPEIHSLMVQYRDPCDNSRVCWKTFQDDVDQVFTVKELEKYPNKVVESPPKIVAELPRIGAKDFHNASCNTKDLCERAVIKVKEKTKRRRILLTPIFRDFDKHLNGHVTRSQMRQCLLSNGFLLSDEELYALEQRFNDDLGFNYIWFLKEAVPKPYEEPLYARFLEEMIKVNSPPCPPPTQPKERDIVLVLAKIKGKVVRERIRVMEFMRDFDKHNEMVISRDEFVRGLSNCRFELTQTEVNTLCQVFSSPLRPGCIDYQRFSDAVEESFSQKCLERAPLIEPLQHIPTRDCEKNFLNFDERLTVSVALQKLSKYPDLISNVWPVLKDFDPTNCGTITTDQFLKALSLRGLNNLISHGEFNVVCKCFSFERGLRDELDYRAFVKALDILHATDKYNPF